MHATKMLAAAVAKLAKDLGVDVQFDADPEMQPYRRDKPLRFRDLRHLPDGARVWVTYKEYGEKNYRVNGAYAVTPTSDGGYTFDDGSSFGVDLYPGLECADTSDNAVVVADKAGEGEMRLYVAAPKVVKVTR